MISSTSGKRQTILAMLCWVAAIVTGEAADDRIDFNRDVRPILSNHCFACHGPDAEQRQADLRLDQRSSAIATTDDVAAIVPGNAAISGLVERITSRDEDVLMPPLESGERLSDEHVAILKRWIDQGATYAKHWSFEPINRPGTPDVVPSDWPKNAVDAFILARLNAAGIEPSTEADEATLIRRVYLDLLGLLPSIEQVDAFVSDTEPRAYERMVDEVLQSQHFGERWGRHWLDQARYADSHGYTNDNERSIWLYRDWVIAAFNRDLPFDQFTTEQLAGDLLDNPTLAQKVATGFHRNTLINSEGGTKADQFRDEQVKDRTDTTGLVWMGLTVGCAKCHSHKFDPVSQAEYYQLYAFFNSTVDRNSVTPTVQVPSVTQTRQLDELAKLKASLSGQLASDTDVDRRQENWEKDIAIKAKDATAETDDGMLWQVLPLSGKSTTETTLKSLDDRSLLAMGPTADVEEYHSTARSPLTKIRSVRLEVLTDDSLPQKGPGRAGSGNFVLSEFWFRTGDGRELRFARAGAEHSQAGYDVAKAIDGKGDTGWAINGAPEGTPNLNRTAWFVLPETLEVEEDHALTFKMQFTRKMFSLGRYRLSISSDEWVDRPGVIQLARLIAVAPDQRSTEQKAKLRKAFVQSDPELADIDRQLTETTKKFDAIKRAIPTTMIFQELEKPRQAYLQVRGDFLRPGENVQPDVPGVLPGLPSADRQLNRLDLAKWLLSKEHPLTARVRMNRIWMRLFGRGLVETENDFGTQGTLPSHPELLDWLAAEFMQQGWSTKAMLRLLMTSAAYRQSSRTRPDLASIDPQNRLLARQSRLRVEAEIIRDLALAVSGKLSQKIGGPGVYPPQPDGVYAFTQRKKNWKTSQDEDRFRRGMYTFFYRSAPYPMLSTFDVPKFNQVCTSRDRSNTPLQSLTLANSEALFELAEIFGQRIIAEGGDSDPDRLQFAFRTSFARHPMAAEVARLQVYTQNVRKRFSEEDKVWTAVARVIMNLDEFVTRE
ncbi:MAG: PSD1 and planctomycete cytochrome C domain-containing protein [Fuerstiella sp.]